MRVFVTVESGARQGQRFEITPPGATVGRADNCQVQMDAFKDLAVSGLHAEIGFNGSQVFVTDRSKGGTAVDGSPLPPQQPREVRLGSRIQLGKNGPVLLIHGDGPGGPSGLAFLDIDSGRIFNFASSQTSIWIGRDSGCQIAPEDARFPNVSRRHCEIRISPQGVFLYNNSPQGTLLNGQPLSTGEARPLNPGDRVQVGPGGPVYQFQPGGPAPSPVPSPVYPMSPGPGQDRPLPVPMHAGPVPRLDPTVPAPSPGPDMPRPMPLPPGPTIHDILEMIRAAVRRMAFWLGVPIVLAAVIGIWLIGRMPNPNKSRDIIKESTVRVFVEHTITADFDRFEAKLKSFFGNKPIPSEMQAQIDKAREGEDDGSEVQIGTLGAGTGSGFVISGRGYILTANHVVAPSKEDREKLDDGIKAKRRKLNGLGEFLKAKLGQEVSSRVASKSPLRQQAFSAGSAKIEELKEALDTLNEVTVKTEIMVILRDKKKEENKITHAKIIKQDSDLDLAVLEIQGSDVPKTLPHVTINREPLSEIDKRVCGMGFSGIDDQVKGRLARRNRESLVKMPEFMVPTYKCGDYIYSVGNRLQISAQIFPGYSGGPVYLESTGEVVGVVKDTVAMPLDKDGKASIPVGDTSGATPLKEAYVFLEGIPGIQYSTGFWGRVRAFFSSQD